MKVVKITNGEVHIKDFCSRKLKKEINKTLFTDVSANSDGKIDGISMQAMDNANDIALVGMVEKVLIEGKELDIKIETFDEMNNVDVTSILTQINKVTSEEIPNS